MDTDTVVLAFSDTSHRFSSAIIASPSIKAQASSKGTRLGIGRSIWNTNTMSSTDGVVALVERRDFAVGSDPSTGAGTCVVERSRSPIGTSSVILTGVSFARAGLRNFTMNSGVWLDRVRGSGYGAIAGILVISCSIAKTTVEARLGITRRNNFTKNSLEGLSRGGSSC